MTRGYRTCRVPTNGNLVIGEDRQEREETKTTQPPRQPLQKIGVPNRVSIFLITEMRSLWWVGVTRGMGQQKRVKAEEMGIGQTLQRGMPRAGGSNTGRQRKAKKDMR